MRQIKGLCKEYLITLFYSSNNIIHIIFHPHLCHKSATNTLNMCQKFAILASDFIGKKTHCKCIERKAEMRCWDR